MKVSSNHVLRRALCLTGVLLIPMAGPVAAQEYAAPGAEASAQPVIGSLATPLVAASLDFADALGPTVVVHPDIIAQVDIDQSAMGTAPTQLAQARIDLAAALERAEVGRERVDRLTVVEQGLRDELSVAVVETESATIALDAAEGDLGAYAISAFVESNALDLDSFSTDVSASPFRTLNESAEVVIVGTRDDAVVRLDLAEEAQLAIETQVDEVVIEIDLEHVAIDEAETAAVDAEGEIEWLVPEIESKLRTATVPGLDFPVVVLDAYYRAALRTAEIDPSCQVSWYQLAGIGRVESGHGTFGGTRVGADGRTETKILGPVLDGTQFASIPDTDGGRHDGDAVWDRAVGPMQFIPGSWQLFGADGNGDGVNDPHNIYDAAMAAANHLCGSHSQLGSGGNYQAALLGYNRSVSYGLMVMGFADGYASAISLQPTPTSVADPELVDGRVAALTTTD